MFEIPDREVRVVSADVPTQPGETDEQCIQCENANAARATRHQQEVDVAAAAAGHPQAMLQKVPVTNQEATSSMGHNRLQPPLSSCRTTTSLDESAYAPEASCETSSKTDMKFTTLLKQT
jgi:hypothetical protein